MTTIDADFLTRRKIQEMQMAAAAATPFAAAIHRELAENYRRQISNTADARPTAGGNRTEGPAPEDQEEAATPPVDALVTSSEPQARRPLMDDRYTIEERPDARGMLIYVLVQRGIDLTSRWTRTDADLELQRLDTRGAQTAWAQLAIAAE